MDWTRQGLAALGFEGLFRSPIFLALRAPAFLETNPAGRFNRQGSLRSHTDRSKRHGCQGLVCSTSGRRPAAPTLDVASPNDSTNSGGTEPAYPSATGVGALPLASGRQP
jgi:hypothetical protein